MLMITRTISEVLKSMNVDRGGINGDMMEEAKKESSSEVSLFAITFVVLAAPIDSSTSVISP